MTVLPERPPLFDMIDAKFAVAGKAIIFAWGSTIYNPDGARITPELAAHEKVHGERQGADIEGWWRRYITDPEFRFGEELPAHQAEYAAFCCGKNDRNARARYLHYIAARLASPMYGGVCDYPTAARLIRAA